VKAYRIKDWDRHFEVAQSRAAVKRLKSPRWIALPVKHDGKGLRRIAAHPRGAEIFAAWVLIVQVAAKMQVRGLLVDDSEPLDAEDMHFKTGFPVQIFEIAFDFLSHKKVAWLEVVNT
jgi:hypothetical protein